jgi:two-component system sensor histidine kinase DesK
VTDGLDPGLKAAPETVRPSRSPDRFPVAEVINRHGWLLAGVWLVFLVFPLAGIIDDPDLGLTRKIGGVALIVTFCAVYGHGFQRQHRWEQRTPSAGSGVDAHSDSGLGSGSGLGSSSGFDSGVGSSSDRDHAPQNRFHLGVLVAIGLILYALVGPAALSVTTYVVTFAVFHLPWPGVFAAVAAGTAVAIGVPVALDALEELLFVPMLVLGVASAGMLIRVFAGHQTERAQLQTRLAVSDERHRVARDVHDVLGHSLTAVILKTELCRRLLDDVEPAHAEARDRLDAISHHLTELDGVSRGALAEIRSTVGGLRSADLADELTVARTVLADAGVDLLVTGDPSGLSAPHRNLSAWVVRETVTNIIRHANASRCHIELAPDDSLDGDGSQDLPRRSSVVLRIADDGVGLGTQPKGNGLHGLEERGREVGATVDVRSGTGSPPGTVVEVSAHESPAQTSPAQTSPAETGPAGTRPAQRP